MNMPRIGAFALALSLAGGVPAGAQTAHDLFQQALVKEQAQGDLRGAIELYERIVAEFSAERPLAARALVQMGRCYEKLGSTEAERAYQRAVREYADQDDIVEEARDRLVAMQRAARAAEATNVGTRRVVRWPRAEASAAGPTPDGRHLVYMDLDTSGELGIRNLATGDSRLLTRDKDWSIWGGPVSPDGQTVSYWMAEQETRSLYLVGIDGSNDRLLYRELDRPVGAHAWTNDSRSIVAIIGGRDEEHIVEVDVAEGSVRLVIDVAGNDGGPADVDHLFISPDDRYAVYSRAQVANPGNVDIWILAMDGSHHAPLVRHPANDELIGWMPGTDEVLFLSDRDGTTDAWTIRVTDGEAQGPERPVRRNMGDVEALGFARDGTLFYSNYTRRFSTGVAPFDLTTGAILADSADVLLGSALPPTWSPDGRFLAFFVEEEGPGSSLGPYRRPLHVRDLATGAERELAGHLRGSYPSWSPDGRTILFNGLDLTNKREGYRGGLYLVDVPSGQATLVVEVQGDRRDGVWSEFGAVWWTEETAILYSRYDYESLEGRLVRRELTSGDERELYRHPALSTRLLALAPDSRHLAFATKSSTQGSAAVLSQGGRISLMDLDSGVIREIHEILEPGRVSSLQWTPDGHYLLYAKRTEDGSTAVWRVPVSGGDAEELWRFEASHFNAYLRLSPDGSRVAYTTYTQETEIWVMENIGEALASAR